jgi:hypothetical protein
VPTLIDLFSQNVMDHLINFMNSNRFSSLPLFHLSLITNPVTSYIHFFIPCSKINYSQYNFGVKIVGSGSDLRRLQ